jgi:hypothetical protein
MDIKSIVVTDAGFDITLADGTVKSFVDASTVNPQPAPGTNEVDLIHTDGSLEKFVKAPAETV